MKEQHLSTGAELSNRNNNSRYDLNLKFYIKIITHGWVWNTDLSVNSRALYWLSYASMYLSTDYSDYFD